MLSLSVIIPVYNEESYIDACLSQVSDFLSRLSADYEIIIVNDGSTDLTAERLNNWSQRIIILKNEVNSGKGFSVRRGLLAGTKKWLLYMDADLSTPINELNKFIVHLDQADALIGSRRLKDSHILKSQSLFKNLAGRFGNILIRAFSGLDYDDTQCGFKMLSRSLQPLVKKMTIDRWGFDVELLYILKKHKKMIREVAVDWVNNEDSKVNLGDYPRTLLELIKIKQNDRMGLYR
ncbi:TPA: family 2 glycosyl transferase [Candidatus Falkowbacteria bacterium]|nr:family 2 glycosyl transferase [Candidatus Falkowbacteria bacterium]